MDDRQYQTRQFLLTDPPKQCIFENNSITIDANKKGKHSKHTIVIMHSQKYPQTMVDHIATFSRNKYAVLICTKANCRCGPKWNIPLSHIEQQYTKAPDRNRATVISMGCNPFRRSIYLCTGDT